MPARKPLRQRKSPVSRSKAIGGSGWGRLLGRIARLPFLVRWIVRLGLAGLAVFLLGLLAFELYFGSLARGYDLQKLETMPERSLVMDSAGSVLGKLHGENRLRVGLAEVSPYFVDALLAREDDRFRSHGGVDWRGVLRASVRNFKDQKATQGASTLSMQLARNSFGIGTEKTLHRKLLEVALTQRIERSRSKDEILELYCNRIYFGQSIYGIERAAQSYFRKPANALALDEAALLAGIIRGPNRYSPWKNYETALIQRDTVLDRMVETGRLSNNDAAAAKRQKTRVASPLRGGPQETYALDAVRRELDVLLDSEDIEDGGLKIYTTLDIALQKAAEQSLERRLAGVENISGYAHQTRATYSELQRRGGLPSDASPEYLQGAAVVLENHSGAIRAIVGGRDYSDSAFNRAVAANRQAGSTFKPIVYAAAVEYGNLFGQQLVSDDPIQPSEIRSAEGPFNPQNSDETYAGWQPADFGLSKSRNTMTVRIGEIAGLDNVLKLAANAGIRDIKGRSAQLYIGNLGTSLKSLTSAFSIFANNGSRCRPFLIDRIENSQGELVFRSGTMEYEVVSSGTAWTINQMLQKAMGPGGTASGISDYHLQSPVAGKTGTTDGYKDAWFVGSTPELTCGIWVGLDNPERIVGQGYGSRLALPVWGDIIKKSEELAKKGKSAFPTPALTKVRLCRHSGLFPGPHCHVAEAAIPADREPSEICQLHGPARQSPTPAAPAGGKPGFWDRVKGWFR